MCGSCQKGPEAGRGGQRLRRRLGGCCGRLLRSSPRLACSLEAGRRLAGCCTRWEEQAADQLMSLSAWGVRTLIKGPDPQFDCCVHVSLSWRIRSSSLSVRRSSLLTFASCSRLRMGSPSLFLVDDVWSSDRTRPVVWCVEDFIGLAGRGCSWGIPSLRNEMTCLVVTGSVARSSDGTGDSGLELLETVPQAAFPGSRRG